MGDFLILTPFRHTQSSKDYESSGPFLQKLDAVEDQSNTGGRQRADGNDESPHRVGLDELPSQCASPQFALPPPTHASHACCFAPSVFPRLGPEVNIRAMHLPSGRRHVFLARATYPDWRPPSYLPTTSQERMRHSHYWPHLRHLFGSLVVGQFARSKPGETSSSMAKKPEGGRGKDLGGGGSKASAQSINEAYRISMRD